MSQHDHNETKPTSDSRRRLVQAGLAGAPLLMMLKSAPALAVNCKQPSGFSVSGNLSKTGEVNCTQPANGPAYWISQASGSSWEGQLVSATLGASTHDGGIHNNLTLLQALQGDSNFVKLMVAAYLDADSNLFPVVKTEVQKMWLDVPTGYVAETTHNTTWGPFELEQYLRYTMGLA